MTSHVARRLAAFGLETVGDLIDHYPRRYEDFRDRKLMRDLKVGEEATVRGVVVSVTAERTARRLHQPAALAVRSPGQGLRGVPWRRFRP